MLLYGNLSESYLQIRLSELSSPPNALKDRQGLDLAARYITSTYVSIRGTGVTI